MTKHQSDPSADAISERERRSSLGGQFLEVGADDVAGHADNVRRAGFSLMENVLDEDQLSLLRDRLDATYERQLREFGEDRLAAIGDRGVCRAPLLYDPCFLALAANEDVTAVARRLLGDWIVLTLQNGILNGPGGVHSQRAWHRDLPYQNWTSSRPLAIGALFLIDAFTADNGGTEVLPATHLFESWPTETFVQAHRKLITAPAGSVMIFDCMVIHRAGVNRSRAVRRAINHNYAIPILKPQFDFGRALGPRPDLSPQMAQLLGYTSAVAVDDRTWREARLGRPDESY
jgi:ectoine hydroxylase-related dioxygenase (phytanoyl-CoA dioxygenase family)